MLCSPGWNRTRNNMPTRDLIAKKAKVSSATVSRVYNDPDSVSPEKRERVLAAAAKYGYVPDKHASALRRNASGSIMFLERRPHASSPDERYYLWLYADVIRAVQSVIDSSMFNLMLRSFTDIGEIDHIREECDAVICHSLTDREAAHMHTLGMPYVCCYRNMAHDINTVFVDEYAGGKLAGTRFREHGLTKPAHITGALAQNNVCAQRWEGFASCFEQEPMLMNGALGIAGGYTSGKAVVRSIKDGSVDSIFIVNDLTAIGVVHALTESGIRIPGDVSLIGYDNLPFTQTLPFSLATIDLSLSEVYAAAARSLLASIRSPGPIRTSITPAYVDGASVRQMH